MRIIQNEIDLATSKHHTGRTALSPRMTLLDNRKAGSTGIYLPPRGANCHFLFACSNTILAKSSTSFATSIADPDVGAICFIGSASF
jgi:hypothetical protein